MNLHVELLPNVYQLLCVCVFAGAKPPALMHQVAESVEARRTVEEGALTEQQLGLRQAEERLYRDYIHRLLKVRKPGSPHTVWGSS